SALRGSRADVARRRVQPCSTAWVLPSVSVACDTDRFPFPTPSQRSTDKVRFRRIERVPDRLFEGEEPILHLIERIVGPLGLRVDQASPWVDARLPDGSRVHAIVPPLSLRGPVLTIRRFSQVAIEARDLLDTCSVGPRALRFLAACVRGRANIVISGGAGSGKTTLLGVLSGFIPDEERLITIEDAAELRL